MSALKILVLMQLKEKINLKGKSFKSKKALFGLIFGLIKFISIVALCYIGLYVCKLLKLFSLTVILPTSVLAVVFTVMLLFSIISATLGLTKSMYYSYDNPSLLTLPCKPTQVYFSKLIVFYIYELIRTMSFIVPLFIAFGIINGLPFTYYPWMFVCFIFISMIPVLVGAILSIPTAFFYNFFRQYKRLQFLSLATLLLVGTIVVMLLIDVIPQNIDLIGTWGTTYWKIQDELNKFTLKFSCFYDLTTMVTGLRIGSSLNVIIFSLRTFAILGKLILILAITFTVGLFTVKPLFYNMASKPFEYRKKNNIKEKKNKVLPKRISSIKTEFLLNIRNVEKVFSVLCVAAALPIFIFFLNKLFGAMNTGTLGNSMAITFNVLIILLVSLSSNYYAASVFSRDGRSSYLLKVQPSKYEPLLLSKLLVNTLFILVSYIVTLFILIYSSGLTVYKSIYLILGCYSFYISHLVYSAELDIMNPQVELYSTIGNNENNPNEIKSTLLAFLISFLASFALFIFLGELPNNGPFIKFMIIGVLFMVFRVYMFLNKIKLYYKEK